MKTKIILFLFLIAGFYGTAQDANELYIKGIQSFDNKKYNEALDFFSRSIDKSPDFEEAYLKRGACFMIFHDFDNAINDFNKVIELNPHNELAYYNRGLAFKNIGKFNPAILDFNEVIKANEKFGLAYFYRALSKMELDDFKGACVDFSKAADLGVETAAELYKYTCKN